MKVSRLRLLVWVIIVLLAILGLVCGVKSSWGFSSDELFGNDLRWRRNEILCAHQGVNSFRIWNRETTLDGFAPIGRNDFPSMEFKPGDKFVHAYPPWHTCFFYFYGWLPEILCISLMSILFAFCIKYIFDEVVKISNKITPFGNIVAGFVLSMIIFPMVICFMYLNYGILIVALLFLLRKFINSDNQVCAGLCWAMMMIKPQIGLLLFWPLFWQKKYITILTAISICFCATCVTALLVNENPITLILQIPEIGRPYDSSYIVDVLLRPSLGNFAPWFWRVGFFVLCAVLSYLTKGAKDFFVLSASTIVLIPLWTYSQVHDRVIMVVWFISLAISLFEVRLWKYYVSLIVIIKILTYIWLLMSLYHLFGCSVNDLTYKLMRHSFDMITLLAAVIFSCQIYTRKIP